VTTIFIPLLFICLNGNCEFMQSTGYYTDETECMVDMEMQKQRMRDLVKMAGQGKIELLEGTCVDFKVNVIRGKSI